MATAKKAKPKAPKKAAVSAKQQEYKKGGGKLIHVAAHVEHVGGKTINHKAYSYYQKPGVGGSKKKATPKKKAAKKK